MLEFACPRCHCAATEEYYGPCAGCREQLRQTQGGRAGGESAAAAYEPKMNVTPNFVATKD